MENESFVLNLGWIREMRNCFISQKHAVNNYKEVKNADLHT